MAWTSDTADALLGHSFGGSAATRPSEWWVQLHYGTPGPGATDNVWSTAGRKQLEPLVLGEGRLTNTNDIEWSELPSPSGNPELQYCTIWTAETDGTCLQELEMTLPNGQYPQVDAGQGFRIPAGQLEVDWQGAEEAESSSSISGQSSSQSLSSTSSSSHSSSSHSSSSQSSSDNSSSSHSSSLSLSDMLI